MRNLIFAQLSAADLAYLNESACYLGVMATAPTSLSINYSLQTRPAGAEFKSQGNGDWTAIGVLIEDISALSTTLLNWHYQVKRTQGKKKDE